MWLGTVYPAASGQGQRPSAVSLTLCTSHGDCFACGTKCNKCTFIGNSGSGSSIHIVTTWRVPTLPCPESLKRAQNTRSLRPRVAAASGHGADKVLRGLAVSCAFLSEAKNRVPLSPNVYRGASQRRAVPLCAQPLATCGRSFLERRNGTTSLAPNWAREQRQGQREHLLAGSPKGMRASTARPSWAMPHLA